MADQTTMMQSISSSLSISQGVRAKSVEEWQTEGESALAIGDLTHSMRCFDAALQSSIHLGPLYRAQGIALFAFAQAEGNRQALTLARKKFKKAIEYIPHDPLIWSVQGNVLCALGQILGQPKYLIEAKHALESALTLAENTHPPLFLANTSWDLARTSTQLAHRSQEASDYHASFKLFEQARSYAEPLPAQFWIEFGTVCLLLAKKIRDHSLLLEGIFCFQHAVNLLPHHKEGWLALAHGFEELYQFSHEEEHFLQAHSYFAKTTEIHPCDVHTWLNWAQFLADSSKRDADVKYLYLAAEKCQHALALTPEDPIVQATYAEILALLGSCTDRLDLMYEAQNKLQALSERAPHLPKIWYSYGICLHALGRYFDDQDYYHQAIERFQTGLSLNRTSHTHWHAIGWIYALLGDSEQDPHFLELSLRFFQKALHLSSNTYYLFDYAVALSKLGDITQDPKRMEEGIFQFERALNLQKNVETVHPDWLFHYAVALDTLGNYFEEEAYYFRAIEWFSYVLVSDPNFPHLHHHLGVTFGHLGDLLEESDYLHRAIRHLRLALKNDEENDTILIDWAITLIQLGVMTSDPQCKAQLFKEAEHKLLSALQLGNIESYYLFACLFSLTSQHEQAIHYLEKARQERALPHLEEILNDAWLEDVRSTPLFQRFLAPFEVYRNYKEEC